MKLSFAFSLGLLDVWYIVDTKLGLLHPEADRIVYTSCIHRSNGGVVFSFLFVNAHQSVSLTIYANIVAFNLHIRLHGHGLCAENFEKKISFSFLSFFSFGSDENSHRQPKMIF